MRLEILTSFFVWRNKFVKETGEIPEETTTLETEVNLGVITTDDILEQAKIDAKYGVCQEAYYSDGGSTEYKYYNTSENQYTILKLNTLEGDKDLVVGMSGKIIDIYKKEVAINSTLIDIPRGLEVLDSLPEQLKKDNKKFQYGTMGTGKRAKEYDSAINYLVNNQLVYRSYKIKNVKSPLSGCKDKDSFKLYSVDTGMLYTMLHLNYKKMITDENIKETLYENMIAKSLVENDYSLFYYQSEGKAEVNFVVQNRMGQILPIEITTKTNSKANKSDYR